MPVAVAGPQLPPSDTDLAWLAGFFDGEGSMNLSYRVSKSAPQGYWVLRVRISNTHFPSIDRVYEIVGSGSRTLRRERPGHRASVSWAVEARAARNFMRMIAPYVVTKREQVELALEAATIFEDTPRDGYSHTEPSRLRLAEIREEIMAHNTHKRVA